MPRGAAFFYPLGDFSGLARLRALRPGFAVAGSAALALHGVPRSPRDIDLVWDAGDDPLPHLARAFGHDGWHRHHRPDGFRALRLSRTGALPIECELARPGWYAEPRTTRGGLAILALDDLAAVKLLLIERRAKPDDLSDLATLIQLGARLERATRIYHRNAEACEKEVDVTVAG